MSATQASRQTVNGAGASSQGSQRRAGASPPTIQVPWTVDVLVVDDDAADTALIIDALKRNPQVRDTMTAASPDRALFQIARGGMRPDLILLDIHMPRVNGFRFLEALRKIPWMAETPVALLTTSRHSKDVEHARQTDACTYIVKPDTYEELLNRLNHVIRQTIVGGWDR